MTLEIGCRVFDMAAQTGEKLAAVARAAGLFIAETCLWAR